MTAGEINQGMVRKTYGEILAECENTFEWAGIEEYQSDAWILFSHYFQMNRAGYFMDRECMPADDGMVKGFLKAVERRLHHVPVQYITGQQEFMGFSFRVTPDVLIPRLDTEVLVEQALEYAAGKRVLDMCTGSGCIILSLSRLASLQYAVGVDISPAALDVARNNARSLHASVDFLQSDLFENISGQYDIIVSNPPYIAQEEFAVLTEEVRSQEPMLALSGGADGLDFYRRIARDAGRFLSPQGRIFLEIGCRQGESVSGLLREQEFGDVKVIKDLAGLDRVVTAVKA